MNIFQHLHTYIHIYTFVRTYVYKKYSKMAILNIRYKCSHISERLIIFLSEEKFVVIFNNIRYFQYLENTNERGKLFPLYKNFTLLRTIK